MSERLTDPILDRRRSNQTLLSKPVDVIVLPYPDWPFSRERPTESVLNNLHNNLPMNSSVMLPFAAMLGIAFGSGLYRQSAQQRAAYSQ